MSRKSEPADGREIIMARIREASKAAGLRAATPMPAYDGRNGLPEPHADRGGRISAFARRMEELRTSFVLCDTLQDAAEGMAALCERAKWRRLGVQSSPFVGDVLAGLPGGVERVTADKGKSALGACEAGIVECRAMDAQTGAVVVGAENGALEVSACAPTLVVFGRAHRLAGSLDEAIRVAGSPGGLTLFTGPSMTYGAERRPVASGHGPTSLVIYLILAEK